ncbi:MAG: small multi-drug export protein [Clostridia bacterium]|nr:small multi-drug export protein [Clostridia bacterium]
MLKKSIYAFLISMLPLIELRGALPYALASGIPTLPAYAICIIGNMIPVPFIYFFATSVLNWGRTKPVIGRFCQFCIEKGNRAGAKLQSSAGMGLYVALLLFVGIPLPGTGAWTGTFAASILHMDFKKSVVAVMAGVLLAGIIMGLLTFLGIQVLT